ncbi:MAG: hypothetical protein K2P61_07320 [Burkholderiaceae bacterium]|nr:hypothetical protein [Burkholderiaceae bacterium]
MHKHIINASPEPTTNTIVTIGIDFHKHAIQLYLNIDTALACHPCRMAVAAGLGDLAAVVPAGSIWHDRGVSG